jgi:hypothetical protein
MNLPVSKKLTSLATLGLMILLDSQGMINMGDEAMQSLTYAVIAYLLGQSFVDLGLYSTRAKADAAANAVLDRIANGELPVRREAPPVDVEPEGKA